MHVVLVMRSYAYQVNIETMSNFLGGMISSATFAFLRIIQSPATPAMHFYYHACLSPAIRS